MKRNTKLDDNDSDSEIWHYKSNRMLKHSKLRRSGKHRFKLSNDDVTTRNGRTKTDISHTVRLSSV